MSRIPNVVQIQNVERLQFSHVLIPYLNGYIKAVTFGLVFTYSTSIICSICPRETQTPHSGVLPVQRPSENTAAATQLFMLKLSTWGYLQTLPVVSPFNIIQ